MSTSLLALIAITIASFFWSTSGIVAKVLLKTFDPFTIALLRSIIASFCIVPLLFKQKRVPLAKIISDIVPIGLLSSANVAFFYLGIGYTTVNASAIIYAATPIIVAIIASITIKEHITKMKLWGIIVGFIGVLLFLLIPALGRGEAVFGTLKGNLILLVAAICWAAYTVASRPLTTTKQYSPIFVTAISLFVSIPVFFIFKVMTTPAMPIMANLRYESLILLLYLGIFVTILTYILFQWSIKHSSSTTTSFTHYLQPVFAFYFSYIFLGETLSANFILGSVLVFVGVFLATGARLIKEVKKIFTNR